MGYKLICMDMDGTLLDDNKKISKRNFDAIKKASEKGIKVVVATGRLFVSANYYSDLIGVKTPVIASNGAYIREKDEDRVIYKSLMGVENCKKIVDILEKYDIYVHFNTYDSILTKKIIYSSAAYEKLNKTLPKDRRINIRIVDDWNLTFEKYKNDILKCIIVENDLQKLNKAKQEMLQLKEFEVVSSNKNNFEVMQKNVSKGRAVGIISKYYNFNKEDIICIGDSENDLSMLKYAGLGIAMENGELCIKEVADYITDTNNKSGVGKAIEKFML